MRFLLLLITIIAVLAVVQTKRHGCKWGGADWLSCVVNNTQKEYFSEAPPEGRLVQSSALPARASAI